MRYLPMLVAAALSGLAAQAHLTPEEAARCALRAAKAANDLLEREEALEEARERTDEEERERAQQALAPAAAPAPAAPSHAPTVDVADPDPGEPSEHHEPPPLEPALAPDASPTVEPPKAAKAPKGK